MKHLLIVCLLLVCHLLQAQPKLFFNFVSHNEENGQWNNTLFYTANRAKLIAWTDSLNSRNATWNMQSDWVYLTNVLSKETVPLMSSTNNKNILRWMHEDKNVEMDPHAHESQYLYPDVVKLMDSVGLPESKLIGGTIYNDSNGINIWTNLVNGQYGLIYPTRFWKPDYMMGGGTPNHINDLNYFGCWNPQSPATYLAHDTSSRLRHLGTGCTMKLFDSLNVDTFIINLKHILEMVHNSSNGFYLQTIFFSQPDLNIPGYTDKLVRVMDSVNSWVNMGWAEWKTLKQSYTWWEQTYAKQMFQKSCAEVTSVMDDVWKEKEYLVFPNPAHHELCFRGAEGYSKELYDVMGKLIMTTKWDVMDVHDIPAGIYFLRCQNKTLKVIIE